MTTSSKIFLAFLLLAVGAGYYGFQQWSTATEPVVELATEPVPIEIPPGTSARDIAAMLQDNGVIRDATAFLVTAGDLSARFQAGAYEIDPSLPADAIIDQLVAGPAGPEVYRVTIPEGLTVEQTLQRIAEAEGSPLTVEQLRAGLGLVSIPQWVPARQLPEGGEAFEGLLFPNTYEFTVEETAAEVLTDLVAETDRQVQAAGVPERNDLSLYENLVLASLIEREARLAEERPMISSVIHNRLDIGQALQIDATVVYGIEVATGERPDRLVNDDYGFASPWSTYQNTGLPPTPISGVGAASLVAAANPDDTSFFYYVVDNPETGSHRFSETLAEHEQAIAEIRGS